jgi:SAM-dependent methyltransferase
MNLRQRYDSIPYRHAAVPYSHPARLGAIGRLHGIETAGPDQCRVLELGCGEGMNLLPLAERFPRSEFVGIDLSNTQITTANEAREACGIENARLIAADLLEFEPEAESFDYVIAHGVYSWVNDAVKDRLLAVCARALKPGGVAYVSYNTQPGWGLLNGLREFLVGETRRETEPEAQLAHGRRVITAMHEALAGQSGAYAELLRQAFADMQAKPGALLFHDELALVNDPRTFAAFTDHAAGHGLQFIAEAHYASMPYEHLPESVRTAFEGLELDFMRRQQFMDVVFQRWLRASVLYGAATPVSRDVRLSAIRECAIGLRVQPADSRINLGPGAPMRMMGERDLVLDFTSPAEKALLAVLAKAAPNRVPFGAALETANRLLAQVKLSPVDDPAEVEAMLYRLFTMDALDLVLTGGGEWLRTSNPPRPSALMRYQARRDSVVVNRWHEAVTVTGDGARWLSEPGVAPNEAAGRAGLLV